jgi:hypothetical protein
MPTLTEQLEKLMDTLKKYRPEQVHLFQQGLSKTQINKLTKVIKIFNPIPQDVYELYGWKNFTSEFDLDITPFYPFLSLENCIKEY